MLRGKSLANQRLAGSWALAALEGSSPTLTPESGRRPALRVCRGEDAGWSAPPGRLADCGKPESAPGEDAVEVSVIGHPILSAWRTRLQPRGRRRNGRDVRGSP